MIFETLPIEGARLVTLEPRGDDRGHFARVFCRDEMARAGLEPDLVQANCSRSAEAGTLRGLHYQKPPAEETKLFRCLVGAVHDVIVDLRPGSASYLKHYGRRLEAGDLRMLYVPRGCAHGFLTLEPDTEVEYFVSAPYAPDHEAGLRFDDPFFDIPWPMRPVVVSDKDRNWPLFNPGG